MKERLSGYKCHVNREDLWEESSYERERNRCSDARKWSRMDILVMNISTRARENDTRRKEMHERRLKTGASGKDFLSGDLSSIVNIWKQDFVVLWV